jgi:hypothetical protein
LGFLAETQVVLMPLRFPQMRGQEPTDGQSGLRLRGQFVPAGEVPGQSNLNEDNMDSVLGAGMADASSRLLGSRLRDALGRVTSPVAQFSFDPSAVGGRVTKVPVGASGVGVLGSGRLSGRAQFARDAISKQFGISNIGGYATSGHVKNSRHYYGDALDVMTNKGEPILQSILANPAAYGNPEFVIWNRRKYRPLDPNYGSRPYGGSSPHTDHLHISWGE